MATKLPQIPAITDGNIVAALQAIKEIIELRSGQRAEAIGSRFITQEEYEAAPQWMGATLLNGWTNYGSPYHNAGYTKDRAGVVRIRGSVNNGHLTSGTPLFRLPDGYKPLNKLLINVQSTDALGRVDITANGDVVIVIGTAGWTSIDNISFLPA